MSPAARTGITALGVVVLAIAAFLLLDLAPSGDEPQDAPRDAPPAATRSPAPRERSASRFALRVVVLRDDWCTAFAGATLRAFRFDPRRMELPKNPVFLRAGDDGVAVFEDAPDGPWLIVAPGAEPGDPAPATARATTSRDAESPLVTVAAVAPAIEVRFDVLARFAPRDGFSTRLVLVREDDFSRREYPFPRVVEPGSNQVVLRVPAGRYEVTTRPLGDLVVRDDERLVNLAESSGPQTLHLDENQGRITVVLEGLPDDELPARVVPSAVDRVLDDRPTDVWWGPFRWHARTMVVSTLRGTHRLAVHGRTRTYLSRDAARLDGEKLVVQLVPAVRLLVDVGTWQSARDSGATIDVTAGDERFTRMLVPVFGPERPDLPAPVLGGELVVPAGANLTIECVRADGSAAWTRTVAADTDPLRVRVEAMDAARN
ncbi:MAG: hypothetical protein HZB39_09615 [Planctomycetes bacterium]|nr:hypothetical protein [Planctomycetota bacterium]